MSTCEYTFDSVVRIVIVSIVITLLLVGFFASVVWLYLVKRNAHKFDISYDPKSAELNIIKSNQLNNTQSRFAFDNPYFKDDDEFIVTNNDKLNFNNYNNEISDATILSNGAALQNDFNQTGQNSIVNNFIKNNRVSSKQIVAKKAWEDSDLYKQPEKISVDLVGRDFFGLGFNIKGDMRNGIYVRDVLSSGPAMESNKIKPGDKLSSITISMKNMVYEDALTILSYASPYNVKINLERNNQPQNKKSNRKSAKLNSNRTLQSTNIRIHHPLYKTRSVDNLIEIGKYDKLNYGTSSNHHINYRLENDQSNRNDYNSRNGYSKIITKLKQQIVTFINPNNNLDNLNQQQSSSNMKNIFKSNKYNWPEEYSGNDNLNAVVVGNNLAFKDDDEDDNFRKEYQLSQMRYQNSLNQNHHHQQYNNSIDQQFNSLQYNIQNQQQNQHSNNLNNKQTNLIKYHQQTMTDLSQVDNMQSMNRFETVNLNDFNQSYNNRHDEMDYSNTRKGNSTQLNDLNDLSLTSSSPINSLPLDDETNKKAQQIDRQQLNSNFTITAQIHRTTNDQINELKEINDNKETNELSKIKNIKDKLRSSSMNDLPNESDISLNPNIINDSMKLNNQHQSTLERSLERAISLDLSNQTDQNEINSKLSKTIFTNRLFTKEDQSKTKRLIKIKNQSNLVQSIKSQSASLGDLSYEQKYILNSNNNNDKLSQSSLNNSLTATTNLTSSLSNGKLSNQSKSIRNSLSTNSTCSSPSSLPSASELESEYKDDESLAYMLKSRTPEQSQSILINNKPEANNTDDDELETRDSILVVNDQHKTNNKQQSIDLFTNKEQAKKIINSVFTMNSIQKLHSNSIKSDQQLQNELLHLNRQIDNDKLIDQAIDKNKPSSNISNFKISSIKKEMPVKLNLINNHTSDHHLNINKSINQIDNQSRNKENELKINYNQLSDNLSSQLTKDDELKELRNKVSRLKKEFSLRSKLIENQNKQNNVNKFRKYSDGQVNTTNKSTNPFLKSKDKQQTNDTSSISKKQEQIINSNALDFESFVFESNQNN